MNILDVDLTASVPDVHLLTFAVFETFSFFLFFLLYKSEHREKLVKHNTVIYHSIRCKSGTVAIYRLFDCFNYHYFHVYYYFWHVIGHLEYS